MSSEVQDRDSFQEWVDDPPNSSNRFLCHNRRWRYGKDRRNLICAIGVTVVVLIALVTAAVILFRAPPTTPDTSTTATATFVPKTDTITTNTSHVFRNATVQWNGYEYFYLITEGTWNEAKIACIAWGGELTSIHSEEENNFIKGLHQGNCNPEKCPEGNCYPNIHICDRWDYWIWIGLHKTEQNGEFLWSDNTIVDYVAWDRSVMPEQPNIGQMAFCAIQSDYDGGWYNNKCAGPFKSVCKRKL